MPNHDVLDRFGIPRDAVITIGGTVGVGKSTITMALAETLGFRTSLEKSTPTRISTCSTTTSKSGASTCKSTSSQNASRSRSASSSTAAASSKIVRFMRTPVFLPACCTSRRK